jgi:hypothetical protein
VPKALSWKKNPIKRTVRSIPLVGIVSPPLLLLAQAGSTCCAERRKTKRKGNANYSGPQSACTGRLYLLPREKKD